MSELTSDQRRIVARERLRERAVSVLRDEGAVAVHEFGSLARGAGDALSDLDLWTTFPDERIGEVVSRRAAIHERIAPIVIRHETARNSPLGGVYSLVLHETEGGIVQVDYYLAPRATSVPLPEARLLAGVDLPRGEWRLAEDAPQATSLSERLDFLICMAFIGVRKVVRQDRAFIAFLLREWRAVAGRYRLPFEPLEERVEIVTVQRLLDQLLAAATPEQVRAIECVRTRHVDRCLDR